MSGIRADHKPVTEWLDLVESGAILLPNFQRGEVWTHHKVETLFDSIIRGRPVGCLLFLKVADPDNLLFEPHKIGGGAPDPNERCEYQLLDGQQRIVALWRALTDQHKERTFFVKTRLDDDDDPWIKSHKRPPAERAGRSWMGKPGECLRRGLIPLRLFRDRRITPDTQEWIREAVKSVTPGTGGGEHPSAWGEKARELEQEIIYKSESIRNFQIPYLTLPADTSRDTAIDVFIKTNTSSTQLTKFDITVGEVQSRAHRDLRAAVDLVKDAVPAADQYLPKESDVGDLVMKVACLWAGKVPSEPNYVHPDVMREAVESPDRISEGIRWALGVLDEESIWDEQRLPSKVPLRVLPALHRHLPKDGDGMTKARKVVRRYLWWAFLSDRYEATAATLLHADYKGLVAAVNDPRKESDIPIFDEDEVEYPWSPEDGAKLLVAPWPKGVSRLARALLAITLRKGAVDIATNERAKRGNIKNRHYHHLFPASCLRGAHHSPGEALAMNCLLTTSRTGRAQADASPIDHLRDRVGRDVKDTDIAARLRTHLVPYEDLVAVGKSSVGKNYQRFLESRARLFHEPLKQLKKGNDWPPRKGH